MTNKSTQLTTVDTNKLAELRAKSGASSGEKSVWPAKLTVNRKPVADDDTPLPMGKYVIKVDGVDHYLTEANTIIMEKGTQFMRFKEKEFIGCTMIETGFGGEYKDTLGGTRLGRVQGMKVDDMTDAQKEAKFYFHLLGVLDVSQATDAKGDRLYTDNTAKYVPMSISIKGSTVVEMQSEFNKLKKKGEAYFDFVTMLTKPHKGGVIAGVPYYQFHFSRGDNVEMTPEILDSIDAIKTIVNNENKRIYGQHLKASQESVAEEDVGDYLDLDIVDDTIPD